MRSGVNSGVVLSSALATCQAFSGIQALLLCEGQEVQAHENYPPNCPPTDVLLVLKMKFLAKIFAA